MKRNPQNCDFMLFKTRTIFFVRELFCICSSWNRSGFIGSFASITQTAQASYIVLEQQVCRRRMLQKFNMNLKIWLQLSMAWQ